jgi:DNA polymerase-1
MSQINKPSGGVHTPLFETGADDVLVIVDLSAFVFRAYHALLPLSSPSGEPTHAVFGTVTMLDRLLTQYPPKMLAFALDSGRPTFRHAMYPKYKANRPEPPEDLITQLVRTTEIVSAYTHLVWKYPGYEADDIIATAVRQARATGMRVLIVGADKDLMQLVGEDVKVWDPQRDKVFGPPEVLEKFGVGAEQVRDFLALTGDSSDNIPGVPSVGPKTAAELLQQFGSIEEIYSHVESITRKKLRDTLEQHRELAFLSRRLVTLHEDCGLVLSDQSLTWSGRNVPALLELYEKLGFQRLINSLQDSSKPNSKMSEGRADNAAAAGTSALQCDWVTTETQLSEVLEMAARARRVAMILHRTDDSAMQSPWAWLTLSWDRGHSYTVPMLPTVLGGPTPIRQELVAEKLLQLAKTAGLMVTTHGARRLWLGLLDARIEEFPLELDVELGDYLLDPEQSHELPDIAARWLGRESLLGQGKAPKLKPDNFAQWQFVASAEVHCLLGLGPTLLDRLAGEGLAKLNSEVELPLSRVLARMQRNGVRIDSKRLETLSVHLRSELSRLEAEAHLLAGHAFNLQSPRQLETLLFDECGLKSAKRTKTGRSTDARTLEALADEHPLIPIVLEHRHLAKLEGTYVHALPTLVNPHTGRVHTSWEQATAATGRISSIEPNLQNIPIRSELGRSIRRAFVAPAGHVLVSSDYSQIELRILAHLSGDPVLLDAFRSGTDVHQRTAMAVFGITADQVSPEMRRQAKAVNFGVIYGQTESGLAQVLGIPRAEASSFIATYFQLHEGVRHFMNDVLDRARQGQAVSTLLGRRRLLPEISSSNRATRLAAERMAMNMPIQGTAADLLKLAMLRLETPPSNGARMVLTVHDELVFEVPEEEQTEAIANLRESMQSVLALSVPLVVDIGAGNNWMDAHDSSAGLSGY